MCADQKRGGVVPVVVPIVLMVPFGSVGLGVMVLELGVMVLEFGVMVDAFGVVVRGVIVERLRVRERVERVVLVDGLLIVELVVVVVVDVLGEV
ncbi:hypothetical protein [Sphingomonas sp.]|uniref:hypothetical protein n=1 Tax=Sphingomonas sp. TaxID=28214 RepID=UPI0035C7BD38